MADELPDDLVAPTPRMHAPGQNLPDDVQEQLPDDLVAPQREAPQEEGGILSRMLARRFDPDTVPRGFLPPELRTAPMYESVARAFGHGFSQQWDADTFGLSKEAVEALQKAGLMAPEGTKSYRETGWKAPFYAFNDLLFKSLWHGGQIVARGYGGVIGGMQEAFPPLLALDAFAGSPTLGIPRAQPKPWVKPSEIKPIDPVERPFGPAIVSRVEAARTGVPHVDAVLNDPTTSSVIDSPVIDRSHTPPYTAGGSVPLDNPTVYIHSDFPREITARRASDPARTITFDPAEPFTIHENVEQHVMEQLIAGGMDHQTAYKIAHFEFAERAEGAWYALHDIDQAHAEELYQPHMDRIQRAVNDRVPPDLYVDPYPHDTPSAARHEALGEPRPTPAVIARAKAILARSSTQQQVQTMMRSAAGRDAVAGAPIVVEGALDRGPPEVFPLPRPAPQPQQPVLIRPSGERVPVRPVLMELGDLVASHDLNGTPNPKYPAELQPRDRSAPASRTWVEETAAKLEPELLGDSPTASLGAPVVGPDRIVESGNGRVLLLEAAYNRHPARAAAYREFLKSRGFDVSGFKRPVLVRLREGDMSMPDRAAFAREANVSPTAGMSTRERAFADAKGLDQGLLATFKPGDVQSAGNAPFVRAFADRLVPAEERPQFMDAQGKLSAEGVRRVEAAMVARAWGEPDIVAALYEAAEPTSKAILGAFADTAPQVAKLKAAVAEGNIPKGADPTPAMLEAFRLVERARSSGQKVMDVLNQVDFERGLVSPDVAKAARLYFRDDNLRQAAGRDAVAGKIEKAVNEALTRQNAVGDLFERRATLTAPRLPRTPTPGDYAGRIAAGSRTASGEGVSAKGKPGKAAKVIEGLTPKQSAQLANQNLADVISDLYFDRNRLPTDAANMDALVQSVAERVNAGIVKPGELQRTHETGHGQTAPEDLPIARQQFAEELTQRLNDPKADPIETAAWIEWRANIMDHPWTDGVGKTSRALAAIPLMRAGEPLPTYPTGRGFFKHAQNLERVDPRDGGAAYLGPQWRKFNDYYHDLVDESRRELHQERAEVKALIDREATPQEIEAHPLIQRALKEAREYPPTNEMPGYRVDPKDPKSKVSPQWKQNRRVILGDQEAVGWDAAQDYLTDLARKSAGEGGVRNERRATIVIGPGGAGKSTIMEPLARKRGAAIIDADEAKKVLPEFRDGVGAGAVHEESSDMMYGPGGPLHRIMPEGGNVMIQKIGHNPDSIHKLYGQLTEYGYSVDLVHVSVDTELAFRRRMGRFLRTGRINPAGYRKMLDENGFKPRQTFLTLQKEDAFNETADVDVNGPSPRLIKADPALAADLGYQSQQPGSRRGLGQGHDGDAGPAAGREASQGGAGTVDGRAAVSAAIDKIGERGNTWVSVPEGEIYLRAGRRPNIGRTLEIPNVEFNEEARGQGAFTRYLDHIEQEAGERGFDAVYAEQLQNPRLEQFLRRRGYVDEPSPLLGTGLHTGDQPTLYKPVQGAREFMAEEPYRLSSGATKLTDIEALAADTLDSAGNQHHRALRDVNEHLQMLGRNQGDQADIAKWQGVRDTLQQWKKDGTQLAGRMVTEEERLGPPPQRNPLLDARDLGVIGREPKSVGEGAPAEVAARSGSGGDAPPPEKPPAGGGEPPASGGRPSDDNAWRARFEHFVSRLTAPEDVKQLIRDAAKEGDAFMPARQGEIPLRDLSDVADAAGVDPRSVDPRGLGRMLRNDAEVRTGMQVMLQATENVKAAARDVKGEASPANLMKLQEAMLRRDMAVEQVVGQRAEWGRTGNVFQEFMDRVKGEEDLSKFLSEQGRATADLEKLAQALTDLDNGKAAQLLSNANKPGFWDKFLWYWVNALISGPITHTKYIVANATFAAYESAIVTPVAGVIGTARRLAGGSREGVYVGEAMARVWGIVAGTPDALVAAAKAARSGLQTPLPGEVAQNIIPKQNRTLAFQQRPIGGVVGTIIGLPSRGASAIHSFFNFLGYRASIEAQGYRAAARDGHRPNEQAFWDSRQRAVDNPSVDMMNAANAEGYRLTYISEVGQAAQKVGEAIRATKVGQLVMPFLHIPFNILARGAEGTPLGLLSPKVRADLMGRNGAVAQDTATARMIAGTAVGAWGVSMVANDRMSGFGPTEPKERAQWLATGHQPYSIRIGDYWYSFNRFGSIGTMLGIYANLGEAIPHMKPDAEELTKALTMTVHATGRLLEDEVGMQGLAGLIEAINDPERKGQRFVSSFVASFLPYSSMLRQTASAFDAEMREVKSIVDGLRYHIPVARQGLLPKRDWLGESVLNPGYGGDIPYAPGASAVIQHRPVEPDPLGVEMKLLDLHPTPPANRIGGVQLPPRLYDEYQVKAGALTRTMLEHFIDQPGWDQMPRFVREELFRKAITQSHQSAAALMQVEHPELIEVGVENKMRRIRGEKAEKKLPFVPGLHRDEQNPLPYINELGKRINPENWERMLRESPESENIEDRREPTLHDVNRGRKGDRGGPMIQ